MRKIKIIVYQCCKWIGLFHLSTKILNNKILVLAYHGFSQSDEHQFMPDLFIHPMTLKRRLELIKKYHFNILNLDDGFNIYDEGKIRGPSLIITIDDGFANTLKVGAPIFRELDIRFTLYLTTYYVTHNAPIWDLTFKYILWSSGQSLETVPTQQLLELTGLLQYKDHNWSRLWYKLKYKLTEYEKQELLKKLADYFKFNLQALIDAKTFHLLNPNEIVKLINDKHIIGLHTHRHLVSNDFDKMKKEIHENQEIIQTIGHYRSRHFCYPSGVYTPSIIQHLQEMGIKTATTCEPGLWTKQTNPYAIPRFLDSESVSEIEFEAEISGFAECIRKATHFFR